jgi:hypothetical protein
MDPLERTPDVPILGLVGTLLVGQGIALGLAWVYVAAIVYSPLIYVNVFGPAGFGLAVGWVVARAADKTKIRSRAAVIALAVLSGLVAVYGAWAADPVFRFGRGIGLWGYHPGFLLDYVRHLWENGSFEYEGNVPTGAALAFFWVLEAAAIVVCAAVAARGAAPQSEGRCPWCHRWLAVEEGVVRLSLEDASEDAVERLAAGEVTALDEFELATWEENEQLRVDLASCPACENIHLLTVHYLSFSLGEAAGPLPPVMQNVPLAPDDLRLVRELQEEAIALEQATPDDTAAEEDRDPGDTVNPQ